MWFTTPDSLKRIHSWVLACISSNAGVAPECYGRITLQNSNIASLRQIGQFGSRLVTYLKGDGVRPQFNRTAVGQLLNSRYRLRACFRAMAAVFTTYANAVNPIASDKREKQTAFYPKGWTVTPLKGQFEVIQVVMPGLQCSDEFLNRPRVLPQGYDGFGLFPKPSALIRELKLSDAYGKGENGADYGKLLEHVLGLIAKQRSLYNYRSGALGSELVWLEERVRGILMELEGVDPDEDFLVLPVNTGNAFAGRTPQWSCEEMLLSDTLPLPALFVGWFLYTNPDRFQRSDDLWVDCCGDRYKASGVVDCLRFHFSVKTVNFDYRGLGIASGGCGFSSASLSGV